MAQSINVNFRMDEQLKKNVEEICAQMGMNLITANPDPFYSESNIRYLEQKMADYKSGRLKLAEHDLLEERE